MWEMHDCLFGFFTRHASHATVTVAGSCRDPARLQCHRASRQSEKPALPNAAHAAARTAAALSPQKALPTSDISSHLEKSPKALLLYIGSDCIASASFGKILRCRRHDHNTEFGNMHGMPWSFCGMRHRFWPTSMTMSTAC